MELINLYAGLLGASITLTVIGIFLILRDDEMSAELKWTSLGILVAGMTHSFFYGPVGASIPKGLGPVAVFASAAGVPLMWSAVRLLFDGHYSLQNARKIPTYLMALGIGLPLAISVVAPSLKFAATVAVATVCLGLIANIFWILLIKRTDDLSEYRRAMSALLGGCGSIYVSVVLAAHFFGQLQGKPLSVAIYLLSGQLTIKATWIALMLGKPSPISRLFRITRTAEPSPLEKLEISNLSSDTADVFGYEPTSVDQSKDIEGDQEASVRHSDETQSQKLPTVSEAAAIRQTTSILQAMKIGKLYRQPGLSIGMLGEHVGLPEHRVRVLINRHLGFKNYTAFLNHFRLAEVATRLRDPAQAHLPVLSIALDVGYSSVAPFNRAFKEAFGQTPSEYRHGESHAGTNVDAKSPAAGVAIGE